MFIDKNKVLDVDNNFADDGTLSIVTETEEIILDAKEVHKLYKHLEKVLNNYDWEK